jgi:hypothetical protein
MRKIFFAYCTLITSIPEKRVVVFLFTVIYFFTASGQTTNISGIINTYHQVVETIPAKACVRVTNAGALNINTKVLIVQMKGASISTANNSSFGDTTSLNNAGNYETGTICYIIGDSVFLFHTLLNNYTPATGKVQLVQFAEYYSANVTDTIKAAPWNNAMGTGGVIALYCDQDLTLNKPVYADSSGYRGGSFVLSNGTCFNSPLDATGYIYNGASTGPQNGAYKGEGVADVTSGQSGGRGAPANGGGGGNNHNNSGGGGANLNAGGRGGGNSSTAGCTSILKGEAGKALSSWSGQKIFMGGGGGAGHSNGGIYTKGGGNGGGIIFIWTNNLIGNGQLITTGGGRGGQSQSDGAGGGGAGGTIIMHVTNYTGSTTIQTNGGDGGNSDDGGNLNRCFGGGGGGGGGAIYFTGTVPPVTITVNGGAAGNETGRDASCAAAQPAIAGSNGQTFSSYTFSRSTDPAGYCKLLLPVKLIYFHAVLQQQSILLQWKISNPELARDFIIEKLNPNNEWSPVDTITATDRAEQYSFIDQSPFAGYNQYRLRIIEKNNRFFFSLIKSVFISPDENLFLFYPNPARDKITVRGNFSGKTLLIITDITGKKILQKEITNNTAISLSPLPPGIYLLRVNEITRKLIIR